MGKFLLWLQDRVKLWSKPATTIGILSDVTCSRADLVVENALLRQQLNVLVILIVKIDHCGEWLVVHGYCQYTFTRQLLAQCR